MDMKKFLFVLAFAAFGFCYMSGTETVYTYLQDTLNDMEVHGVVWSPEQNAAYFNGDHSYVAITNSPFAEVSGETGFTISMDVNISPNSSKWGPLIDVNFGTQNDSYFFINGGKGDGSLLGTLRTVFAYGGKPYEHLVYVTNTDYCNRWINIRAEAFLAGSVKFYIDGELVSTSGHDTQVVNVLNILKDMPNVWLGKSAFGEIDGYFQGYIKNLVITNSVVTPPGDVNGDGEVLIDDVSDLIDLLLRYVTEHPRADVDDDGSITISDVTALVDLLLASA